MEVTKGFEQRIVRSRGSGDPSSDELSLKVFTLSAGEHELIIVGHSRRS